MRKSALRAAWLSTIIAFFVVLVVILSWLARRSRIAWITCPIDLIALITRLTILNFRIIRIYPLITTATIFDCTFLTLCPRCWCLIICTISCISCISCISIVIDQYLVISWLALIATLFIITFLTIISTSRAYSILVIRHILSCWTVGGAIACYQCGICLVILLILKWG